MKDWANREVICAMIKTGRKLKVGDITTTFRGDKGTLLEFLPPHRENTSGKIRTTLGTYYSSVCGAKYMTLDEHEAILNTPDTQN